MSQLFGCVQTSEKSNKYDLRMRLAHLIKQSNFCTSLFSRTKKETCSGSCGLAHFASRHVQIKTLRKGK